MNKIFESDLIFKIYLINELKRKEFMNQYKFSGTFVEEITKQIDSTNKESKKQNFYLQDALIYLKTTKKKYDLIIVDVAGDEGIDERFCEQEYLNLIKKCLAPNGIFVSNMPSSRDIFNPKNKFALDLIKLYRSNFAFVDIYNGETSNKIFYKTFFNIDEVVFDITNMILISSDKRYEIKNNNSLDKLVNIEPFLNDLCN